METTKAIIAILAMIGSPILAGYALMKLFQGVDDVENDLRFKVNGQKFYSNRVAKTYVLHLEQNHIDFTIEVFDGYSWKPFGKNVKPPQWEQ